MLLSPRFSLLFLSCLAVATPALAADVEVELDTASGFVVQNSGASVERLRVDEATGNISRNGALFVHTTGGGGDNLFVGPLSGNLSVSGADSRNTGVGFATFYNLTTGNSNSAFGARALLNLTTGIQNTALGREALVGLQTGDRNTAVGHDALRENSVSGNSALGWSALRSNTTGTLNTAVGYEALRYNTTGGDNSALGNVALRKNTTGQFNTAVGSLAMRENTTGISNSGFGTNALNFNSTGSYNSAVGNRALYFTNANNNSGLGFEALRQNNTGADNSAFGHFALRSNTSGSRNLALGQNAGVNQTTGSDNIYLANLGVAAESGRIKIGNTSHTATYIEGIDGVTLGAGSAVYIDTSNQLGTGISSSLRTKTDVVDMGDASDVIEELRPVLYRYRADVVGESESEVVRYGLIAEEVAGVAPQLVTYDDEGKPNSVQYRLLTPLLLNELQEQQQLIAALTARLEAVEGQLATTSEATER